MVFDLKKTYPILIGIHLVALPLYMRTHFFILLVVFSLTVWSLLIISKRIKQPPDLVRVLALVFSVSIIILVHGTIFGQEAGTSLLLILALLKIFEIKSQRDTNTIIFISYFLIASNFFFTQSPLIALYVFAVVIYLTSTLVYLSDLKGSINFSQRLFSASRMVAIAIPFMLILFILFPRLPTPLWGLPKDAQSAITGLSDELTLGNISNLVASGEVAFRVTFDNKTPPYNQRYWRGPVLSQFDGKTWTRSDASSKAKPNLINNDSPSLYQYTVTLEPHNKNWLLALEHPVSFDSTLRLSRELQLIYHKRTSNIISYSATSETNASNFGLFSQEKSRNLQLPIGFNPKTQAFALKLMNDAKNDHAQFVHLVLSYFRNEQFYYTLSPPPLGRNAIDDFLFSTQKGFCEHYASTFVTLMRNAGVPARIVTGYQGGITNPIDNYMIVRQSDAHAWAEVWLDNKGWVRIDPTAAVAPSRIESGITSTGIEREKLPPIIVTDNEFLKQSRFIIDSMHNTWNKWIVGYNRKKQEQLFNSMGVEKVDTAKLVLWLVISMTVVGALAAAFLFRNKAPKTTDRALHYYNVFCEKLNKAGIKRNNSEGEEEFLIRIKKAFPKSARAAEIITRSYQQIRYNSLDNQRYEKNFINVIKKFKPIRN